MRNKDKISCDYCMVFIKKLTKKQMEKVMKDRYEGTRTNCSAMCIKCQDERDKILEALKEKTKKKEINIQVTQKMCDEIDEIAKEVGLDKLPNYKPYKPHKIKALFG